MTLVMECVIAFAVAGVIRIPIQAAGDMLPGEITIKTPEPSTNP